MPCDEDIVYAVLVTGGKQYTAKVGQVLTVEKLDIPVGQEVQFDQVLLLRDDAGTTVGTPVVAGAQVTGKVVRHPRGPKDHRFQIQAQEALSAQDGPSSESDSGACAGDWARRGVASAFEARQFRRMVVPDAECKVKYYGAQKGCR